MSISKLQGRAALDPHESAAGGAAPAKSRSSPGASVGGGVGVGVSISGSAPGGGRDGAKMKPATKSSAASAAQKSYLPQSSLLKIEPFVPSFNSRLRRPIHRSYSTLSSTYLKRTLGTQSAAQAQAQADAKPYQGSGLVVGSAIDGGPPRPARPAVAGLRCHPGRVVARQRSKSTSSSASTRLAANGASVAGAGAGTALLEAPNAAIVTQQPNGICRIARQPKEQEKLPDRINYDRRGLTAIPIFEHEPNLRLLSLQHNLINVFHIPSEPPEPVPVPVPAATPADASAPSSEGDASQQGRTPANGRPKLASQHHQGIGGSPGGGPHASPTPPPVFSTKSALRGSLLQKSVVVFHAQQPPPTHPSLGAPPHLRLAMKKSNSFVSNYYSRHLGAVKRNLQNAQLARADAAHLKSFDSGASVLTSATGTTSTSNSTSNSNTTDSGSALATSELEEDAHLLELNVKNRQLANSYGTIFQNLVFLDLYDNQIERIANLDGLPTLSVLLLGKNRITDIGGLASLKGTLRVLDLHGNKITSISNRINCLQELKSLNLAGNQIRQINQNDFNGLLNLRELNLKRNKIKRISGFQHLTALERLWLCHNDLHKVEDMASIAKAINLLEVTIENNPVSLAGDCVSFLVSYLPRLQSLSQMPITDQVRRAAMAWRKNKELSDANYSHLSSDVFNSIRREEVISNARTNWELLRSQQTVQSATQRGQRRSAKQSELAKISESNEAVAGLDDQLQEFIKLPPIQQQPLPLQQQLAQQVAAGDEESTRQSNSSNSSLGPNVDSSSSCFSSDNEESPKVARRGKLKGRFHRPASASTNIGGSGKNNNCSSGKSHHNGNSGRTKPAQLPGQMQEQQQRAHNEQEPAKEINQGDTLSDRSHPPSGRAITARPPDAPAATSPAQIGLSGPTAATSGSGGAPAVAGGSHDPSRQTDGVRNEDDNGSSLLAAPGACGTMHLQADKPNAKLRPPASGPPRATTPTTAVTASSTTLSLGFLNGSGNGSNNVPTAAPTTGAAPPTSVAANPRRYMQGSLMRSHTIVGASGARNHQGAGKAGGNHGQNQAAPTATAAANNGADQSGGGGGGGSVVSCIVAPAAATTTATGPSRAGAGAVAGKEVGSASNNSSNSANTSNTATNGSSKPVAEREREQGGDYLIEICGRYLNIYGQGALRFIDKQWNPTKASDVHTLNFSYINFNNIAAVLGRIKVRFPHAENFVFRETNISCLGQLNALAELQGIASLFIDPEGNAITTKDLWRLYAVYRLSHWGLKLLNGTEVTEAEVDEANAVYAGLSDLVLWSMPEAMLQPLLARLRLDETCTASKLTPKEWLMKADKSLRVVVGKEALQWKKTPLTGGAHAHSHSHPHQPTHNLHGQDAAAAAASGGSSAANGVSARERGKMHFALMMENTCNAVEKLHKLETLWPSLLLDIVRNTLLDYSQLDAYLRNLMSELMK